MLISVTAIEEKSSLACCLRSVSVSAGYGGNLLSWTAIEIVNAEFLLTQGVDHNILVGEESEGAPGLSLRDVVNTFRAWLIGDPSPNILGRDKVMQLW